MEKFVKKSNRFSLIATVLMSLLFVHSIYAASPNCQDLKGHWINELGSTLIITGVKKNGRISGRFISPLQAGGEEFLMMGWANDTPPPEGLDHMTAITFAVNWGRYGSLSSWSGGCALEEGIPTMSMIWNLVLANAQFDWGHILSNSDSFRPKK